MLPRCIQALFEMAAVRTGDAEYVIEASCCEIYNETITDLLAGDKQRQLQVHRLVLADPEFAAAALHMSRDM